MNEFGNFLSSLRKRKGMTQQELADKLGVTNKAISKWETGEAFPDTALLVPLADIFGITVDELLRGRQAEPETAPPNESQAEAQRENVIQKYAPVGWRKKFALLICLGIGLIFAGVITVISVALATDNDNYILCATGAMLALIAAGVDFLIVAGIVNDNAFLPVSDPLWRKNVGKFAALIVSGFTSIMLAVVSFVVFSIFENKTVPFILGMVVGFVLLFGGIVLLVYGGISWDGYSKHIKASLKKTSGREAKDALTVLTKDSLGGRISGAIMLSATAVYLVLGFVWNLWHPGWIIFPVGGIVCGIINVILGKK